MGLVRDIDPAIPAFMMQKENLSAKEIDSILNKKSGVLGVTGGRFTDEGCDRTCQQRRPSLQDCFDIEAYRLKKYIGSYMAAVGDLMRSYLPPGLERWDGQSANGP